MSKKRTRNSVTAAAIQLWLYFQNYVQKSEEPEHDDLPGYPYDDELDDTAIDFVFVEDSEDGTVDDSGMILTFAPK